MYKLLKNLYNNIKGEEIMKKTYTIIVHKEEEGYWAECPKLKGCFAQANTIEELKKLMTQSIYLYFEDNSEEKRKVEEINLELSYA